MGSTLVAFEPGSATPGRSDEDTASLLSADRWLEEDAPGLVGRSALMADIRTLVDKVAPSSQTVLITGENGTGKGLVARPPPQRHRATHSAPARSVR